MATLELFQQIFFTCVIPLIGILSAFAIKWLKEKIMKLQKEQDNALFTKYTDMLISTVETCVQATNQTYVDELKAQGKFGYTEHNIAYHKTLNAVKGILTKEAQTYLENIYGDLDFYISQLIQENVRYWKEQ